MVVRVSAANKPIRQRKYAVGPVQPGNVVTKRATAVTAIQIDIATHAHMVDAANTDGAIEVIESVFDGHRVARMHEVSHARQSDDSAFARGGGDHIIRFAARGVRQCAAVGVGDQNRLLRSFDRVETGSLTAVGNVDRHAGCIHARDDIGSESGESPIAGSHTAGPEAVHRVVSELREPLPDGVEAIDVFDTPDVIRILHAQDDADFLLRTRPRQVIGVQHANEVIRMRGDKAVPLVEPASCESVRIGPVESHGGMKHVYSGAAQLPEIRGAEVARNGLPPGEQRPIQRKQTEHVNDVGLQNQVYGSGGSTGRAKNGRGEKGKA